MDRKEGRQSKRQSKDKREVIDCDKEYFFEGADMNNELKEKMKVK